MLEFMATVGYPFLAAAATGGIGLLTTWGYKAMGMHKDSVANTAVQNMVGNFAGRVVTDITTGKLTLPQVIDGQAGKALMDYAASTVKDSMDHLGVTPQTLSNMLLGKVGQIIGVPPDAPALMDSVPGVGPTVVSPRTA